MRKAVSPPKKASGNTQAQTNQATMQNAYQQASQPQQQQQQSNNGSAPMAAQATQVLLKRQLTFTQEQLVELSRAGRFGKKPVPQEYAVIPPQAPEFKGRKTLVLDLDETLIHSKFSEAHLRACRTRGRCDFQMRIVVEGRPIQVYVLIRPGVLFFLQKLASIYEIVLYTASMSIYANPLVDTLDQDSLIPMRLYREHCFSFQGSYIKDLSLLGRDMKDVLIVDNSPNAYYFHNENAVPILSWYDDPDDRCLFEMIPLLEALSQVNDVRQVIPKFVRKDINLVDFPKAAWVLNDAYRQMHSVQNGENKTPSGSQSTENVTTPATTANAGAPGESKNSKKALSPSKQPSSQTPKKGTGGHKLEDAYERKPSPINLKPLSPRQTQTKVGEQPTGDAASKVLSGRKDRTFSPRQLKISSKQQQPSSAQESDSVAAPQGPTTKNHHGTADNNTATASAPADHPANKASKKGDNETSEAADSKQRGKSQGHAARHQGHRQFSPVKSGHQEDGAANASKEDEVAIDQVQRRSRRKVSNQLKQNESSDLEHGPQSNINRANARGGATQEALDAGLAAEQSTSNQLYQKVSQRKGVVQRNIEGTGTQAVAAKQSQLNGAGPQRRKPSANPTSGTGADSNDTSRLSSPPNNASGTATGGQSKNASYSQGRVGNVQLEINTNKAELAASGPLVDLPPHLQKIMQARSTTNKTSSMARQAIVIPQGNIITPVNGKLVNSHRIGTSNGLGQKGDPNADKASGLNSTFQNIPKSNNLFQTSPTELQGDHQTENLSSKRLHGHSGKANGTQGGVNQGVPQTENLNRSFSNQAGVTNGSLSTAGVNPVTAGANSHQSSTTWASRQQMSNQGPNMSQQTNAGHSSREGSSGAMIQQHNNRMNTRRKLSRNEQASNGSTPGAGTSQINVQQNLSIRRGITRYQQVNNHSRGQGHHDMHSGNNMSGVMSSRNESGPPNNVKLIGKNSLHMKRRSEYPAEATSSKNQWHLPDPAGGPSGGIITSESQKNTQASGFNFQKHSGQPSAAWGSPTAGSRQDNTGQVAHSQSQSGVSSTSHNQKRVINQSVGQLSNVKHINSAQLANVPVSSGHKKVQSLLSNIQQRETAGVNSNGGSTGPAARQIHIIQPGVGNTQPTSHLNANGLVGSQSSSTRHRKPPMLVRTNHTARMGAGGVGAVGPGTQPNSTQNRNRTRDQWINFANIMHQSNVPGAGAENSSGSQLTPMGNMGHHKLSSDFIVKNSGSQGAAASGTGAGQNNASYLGLMQTQPLAGGLANKAKFKQAKPLTNNRGKSVPQERPSNTQGNHNAGNHSLGAQGHANLAQNVYTGAHAVGSSATKSQTGIRISSQRQQFISSSNKTIKTLKQFNQSGGRQQSQTAEHQQK